MTPLLPLFLIFPLSLLAAQAPQDDWREAAAKRIEQIRKDTLRVRVVDAEGRPVAGAAVKVTMTGHEFGFGTAVAARQLLGQGEDSERYRQFIRENFNMVVLENDLKWPQWQRDREPALQAVKWLRENGISRVRGHTLVWPSWRWLPKDLKALEADPPALRERVRAHIEDIVTATRGTLAHWDVLNEPFSEKDLMGILGNQVMAEWFKEARRHDANTTMFINDYGILSERGEKRDHQNHYYQTIRDLLAQGAPLEGIGMQGHFSEPTPPARMLEILNRFSEFGLPIAITEFDFQTKDEELQAAFFRDFLTLCFSHPRVQWFLMWGFWEARHWRPDAAMLRRDWTPKKNFAVWRELVHGQWWTRAEAVTDANGVAAVRGYLGQHRVEARRDGRAASAAAVLRSGGPEVLLRLE